MLLEFRTITFAGAITSSIALMTQSTLAQNQYEHCNAVLQGDLINRIVTSSAKNTASNHAWRQYTFSRSEAEAYEDYKKIIENGKKQGQKGGLGVNYFGIGGEADFEINYDRQLNSRDFSQKFNKAKAIYLSQGERVDSSASSLASSFASYVRDANSIDAWKACVSRGEQPGLYAFASRDDSEEPALNVVWSPGHFSSTFPAITIGIALPAGASMDDSTTEIGIGSGRTYRIAYPEHKRGFQVSVNGELRNGEGQLVNSFTTSAQVPRIRGEDPPVASPTPAPPPPTDCTWGKNTCKAGFVWRLARANDLVCVTPRSRAQAADDNAKAPSRRIHTVVAGKHRYRCISPYVWRRAFGGDRACVTRQVYSQTRIENVLAKRRIACGG